MNSLLPKPEAAQAFLSNADKGPVVMLNLLKFKADGGEEAYGKYAEAVGKIVASHGGKVIYAGRAAELMVGADEWDAVALVQYPTRKALIEMFNSPEYQAIHHYREEGLERTVLYATDPLAGLSFEKSE
ncbi:MAG: DUF1330 domain-containing protein [Candidatus Binatia bacterium]